MMGLAGAFFLILPQDLAQATRSVTDASACLAAEAGIKDTMAWMSTELASGSEPCTSTVPSPTRTGTIGEWSWSCLVEADPQTPPHGVDVIRLYRLESTASLDGEEAWRIEAWVQAGQSFARFAEYTNISSSTLWDHLIVPGWKLEGPVHTNGVLRLWIQPPFFGGAPPAQAAFSGELTSAGSSSSSPDGVVYQSSSGAPYNYADGYDRLLAGGRTALATGVPPKAMPTSSFAQAAAAWGGNPPATPPAGVSVNATGGVFIHGDVTNMTLGFSGSGNSLLTINQGGQITTVEEDPSSNQRIVTLPDGTVQNVTGIGSGVIFATGDINGLSGTNKGAHTIAVDFAAMKNITVTQDILRADTPDGSKPTGTADRLGIVTNKLLIADHSVLPRTTSDPLSIYATLYCTDRLEVINPGSGPPGALAIYGGLAGNQTWRWGNFSSSFTVLSGYGGVGGIGSPNIFYDASLANEPPPTYPTTAGSDLSLRAWLEEPL